MEIKKIENEDNFIIQATQQIWCQVLKDEDKLIKNTIVDYAKKNDKELMLLDENIVKIIIDLGCKQYIHNYKSKYISKDKIKEKIKELENGTYDAKIILQELLEERKENE